MARYILGRPQYRGRSNLEGKTQFSSRISDEGPALQHRLRHQRTERYLEAIQTLDAGIHSADHFGLSELLEAIASEFPDLGIEELPIGLVMPCFLGPPYEVHICDLNESIVEHFETFRPMPPLFERARAIALHPAYVLIEVYATTIRTVSRDGSVSVLEL